MPDMIIVGQGLAGSLLAWALLKRGQEVLVVDNGAESASRIAAGLFNPITGRRMTESWRAGELLPFAEKTYRELEHELGTKFYHPMPMLRLFTSSEERDASLKLIARVASENFIGEIHENWSARGMRPFPSGGLEIRGAGYVDTAFFLSAFREWLLASDRVIEIEIKYQDIVLSGNSVEWQGHKAGCVVFCDGYRGAENPWFHYLPWNLCKGELLTIHAPGLAQEVILSRGIYILPLGDEKFRVGATYAWDEMDAIRTATAARSLTTAVDELLNMPYTILDHKAGVRPSVRHRRPFLGRHPQYPQLAIFNGLGTKGVTLAPFFASQMADHLIGSGDLDVEVDIRQLITHSS